MKAIGFKNFRKFEDFPNMEFAPITVFVGGNNSGKSTTVKAIISVLSFLQNARIEGRGGNNNQVSPVYFYFNQNPYIHIGTFKRAKCNKNDNNDMFFSVIIEELKISLWLNGDGSDDNTTYAKLQKFCLEDTKYRTTFIYDFQNNLCEIIFKPNEDLYESNFEYREFLTKIKFYEEKVRTGNSNASYSLTRLVRQCKDKFPIVRESFTLKAKISDIYGHRLIGGPLVSGIIYNTCYYFMDKENSSEEEKFKDEIEKVNNVRNYVFQLSHRIDILIYMSPIVEYIYAHAASQIVLYTADDNNYLSKTIHDFASRRLDKNYYVNQFLEKWMNFFEIGERFELISIGGEAHTFYIIDFDGKKTPLADKGMGTIQLMILLLRISIILNERNFNVGNRIIPKTIIIEEPEQNLHPRKQSQLIEFFHTINSEYGIRFIIETHSEYLIRNSQVMVAEKKYSTEEQLKAQCPFKVYFFKQDGTPYDMTYQTNGRFAKDFESGFIDEASKYAILLSKIERGRI